MMLKTMLEGSERQLLVQLSEIVAPLKTLV